VDVRVGGSGVSVGVRVGFRRVLVSVGEGASVWLGVSVEVRVAVGVGVGVWCWGICRCMGRGRGRWLGGWGDVRSRCGGGGGRCAEQEYWN